MLQPSPLRNHVLAVIDVGGNSISLEFRDALNPLTINKKLPKRFKNYCQLARSISDTGSIDSDARDCATNTLAKMLKKIKALEDKGYVVHVKAIGTAPFRDADNGKEVARLIRQLGVPLEVISGEEEAEYSGMGALAHFPNLSGIVVDTGGGSTEFTLIENGEIKATKSLPLGNLRIKFAEDPRAYIAKQLEDLPEEFRRPDLPLLVAGGTFRNIARSFVKVGRGVLSEDGKIQKTEMMPFFAYARILSHAFHTTDPDKALSKELKINKARTHLLQPASLLLGALREELGSEDVILSKVTMRDGIRAEMIADLMEPSKPQPFVHHTPTADRQVSGMA